MTERDNHVVIVGCGRTGAGLATRLTSSGYTVSIIDKRAEAFRRLPDEVSAERLVGIGFDQEVLEKAGVRRAAAVASVTNGDNSNIIVARVAREHFGVPRVVARIYDPRRAAIYERVGIPTVATVQWTIEQVLSRLVPEDDTVIWNDATARVVMLERPVPPRYVGRRLSELDVPGVARVVIITRLGAGLIPTLDTVGQEGDVVTFAVEAARRAELDRHLAAAPGGH